MSKWTQESIGAAGREEVYRMAPEDLTIINDKSSPLYDERLELPVEEAMVLDVLARGVTDVIKVRRNGSFPDGRPRNEVVDGRQRTRWALEANRRLHKESKPPITLRLELVSGSDQELFECMVRSNTHRQNDRPFQRARKMARAKKLGFTPEQIGSMFRVSETKAEKLLSLLDLHPSLQQAADEKVPLATIYALGTLPRDEQEAALVSFLSSGVRRGLKAASATAQALGPARSGALPKDARRKAPSRWLSRLAEAAQDRMEKESIETEEAYLQGVMDAVAAALGTDEAVRERLTHQFGLDKKKRSKKVEGSGKGEAAAEANGAGKKPKGRKAKAVSKKSERARAKEAAQ